MFYSKVGTNKYVIRLVKEEEINSSIKNFSDEEMNAFGGHLVKGVVSATVEIILTAFGSKYTKSFDKETGLKLWDIEIRI